jgi:hypothetical protein
MALAAFSFPHSASIVHRGKAVASVSSSNPYGSFEHKWDWLRPFRLIRHFFATVLLVVSPNLRAMTVLFHL